MESTVGSCVEMKEDAKSMPECTHYKRNCRLQAPCCLKFYPCRFCHNDDNFSHEMDRHKVQNIQCVTCDTVQKVSNQCVKCSIQFGEYFCAVCRLYDSEKGQFHCDKCGICRVGPKEDFFHCDTCNACLSTSLKDNHKCVVNASMSVCPICREYLHTSRMDMSIPRCGHMIHKECLQSYHKAGSYQCPICKESLVDMTDIWRHMDEMCASVQMSEELRNLRLNILCQDCHKECEVPFNTEGLKCVHCGSYNTTQT